MWTIAIHVSDVQVALAVIGALSSFVGLIWFVGSMSERTHLKYKLISFATLVAGLSSIGGSVNLYGKIQDSKFAKMDAAWQSLYTRTKEIQNDEYSLARLAFITSEINNNHFPPQSPEQFELLVDLICSRSQNSRLLPKVYEILSPYLIGNTLITKPLD